MEEKLSSSATSCSSAFNFLLTDLRLKSLTNRLLHLRQNFILTFKIIKTWNCRVSSKLFQEEKCGIVKAEDC